MKTKKRYINKGQHNEILVVEKGNQIFTYTRADLRNRKKERWMFAILIVSFISFIGLLYFLLTLAP